MTDARIAFEAAALRARVEVLQEQLQAAREENATLEQERDMWMLRAEEQGTRCLEAVEQVGELRLHAAALSRELDHWRHRYEIATGRGGK